MPRAIRPSAISSPSRDLVAVGPTLISANVKNATRRNKNGEKPTTVRAMILRNGAQGAGELMLIPKLSGREKLDLLAEDLLEKSKKAVMSPFRLEQCLKIAESQCNAFLDDITNLRDPQLFEHIIQAELNARTKLDPQEADPSKNSSYVASTIATRIHNTYLLASAWKLVLEILFDLAEEGVTDGTIKSQLKTNAKIRARYLTLYDLVGTLVDLSQVKFAVLATTTPHYSRYFKQVEGSDINEPEMSFDWAGLREACVSFLDSIVVELCFPRALYPKAILYQVLRDAIEESPKEAKRFPQALWDAVGDLSVSVEFQQLLETPLVGPDGQYWKNARREMPEDYRKWVNAQVYSEKAAGYFPNYEDFIFPLEKTKTQGAIDNMWKYINLNYKTVSGKDIDALWGLTDALKPSPQWHSFYIPELGNNSDWDSDTPGPLVVSRHKKSSEPFSITSGSRTNSSSPMPELKLSSNSSGEDDSGDGDAVKVDGGKDIDSDGSGYDEEREEELRELLREAMDIVHEADWLHSAKEDGNTDSLTHGSKGNPFLKLFGSLRGRMFSSNPKLKTVTHKEPLKAKLEGPSEVASIPQRPVPPLVTAKVNHTKETKVYRDPAEDAESEEDSFIRPKKKKKKPKKKKKSTATEAQQAPAPAGSPTVQSTPLQLCPPQILQSPIPPTSFSESMGAKLAPQNPTSTALFTSLGSTTSLPLPSETVAQSARSYIQSENLDILKTKVKSRPNHATTFTEPEKRKSMFSKIMGRGQTEYESTRKSAKYNWFSRLGKKSKSLMHQLLNTAEDPTRGIAPMKWEHFLKVISFSPLFSPLANGHHKWVMREMGFEYDPSTAGSSVRFDPPDKRDRPITFHKPHPDPTLHPIMLKDYAKRLKKTYGWDAEDFLKDLSPMGKS